MDLSTSPIQDQLQFPDHLALRGGDLQISTGNARATYRYV
jgi:hypothetical protein